MWSRVIVPLLLSVVMIGTICCSELQGPMESESEEESELLSNLSLIGSFPPFSDDFETGLDQNVWYLESVNGVQWTHITEEGNGYIYSPPQNPYVWSNRYIDILTVRDDYTDFIMTWDMRFHTSSWHKDHRWIMFRSTNDPNPLCTYFYIGVSIPTYTPQQCMSFVVKESDYIVKQLTPLTYYPWELSKWYSFKLDVEGNVFKVKVWEKGHAEPSAWSLEAVDPDNTHSIGRIGFGDYWGSITDVDNVTISPRTYEVYFDIKPGSCPNPLNITFQKNGKMETSGHGGVLPAAILGTEDLDVYNIDVSTVRLEGMAPIRYSFEDVTAPAASTGYCECDINDPDEKIDLVLKFSKIDIINAIGPVSKGDIIEVTITGMLLDGTYFEGVDCLLITGRETVVVPFKS